MATDYCYLRQRYILVSSAITANKWFFKKKMTAPKKDPSIDLQHSSAEFI